MVTSIKKIKPMWWRSAGRMQYEICSNIEGRYSVVLSYAVIQKYLMQIYADNYLVTLDLYTTMCYTKNVTGKEIKVMYRKITHYFEEWKK